MVGGRFPAGVDRFWARGTRGCEEVRSGRLSVVKGVAETSGWGDRSSSSLAGDAC